MHFGAIEWQEFRGLRPDQQRSYVKASAVFVPLVSGILILAGGTYTAPKVCIRGYFMWPIIAIGLFLMLISVMGICSLVNKDEQLYHAYMCSMSFIAILAIIALVIFGYVAVGGIDVGRVKVREYNLEEYHGWLRNHMVNRQYWARTSACLLHKGVCDDMRQLVRDPDTGIFIPELSKSKRQARKRGINREVPVLLPIEAGCCKPPSSCGLTYVNGTTWTATPGAPASVATNVDCSRWSNDPQTLCYQCDSCKAGFLDDAKKDWSFAAMFPVLALICLIVCQVVVCKSSC